MFTLILPSTLTPEDIGMAQWFKKVLQRAVVYYEPVLAE